MSRNHHRLAVAFLVCGLILPSVLTYVYFFWLATSETPLQRIGMGLGKVAQFALPLVWFFVCRPAAWPTTGNVRRALWLGMAFGALVFTAIFVLYHGWLEQTAIFDSARRAIVQKIADLGFATPLAFLGLGTFYVVLHSFLEEYYWRWFVFRGLTERMGWGSAVFVSSVGFMSHHVLVLASYFGWLSPATWFFSLSVAVGGAAWAWLYHSCGTLRASWLSHAIVDAAIFLIGYQMLRGG